MVIVAMNIVACEMSPTIEEKPVEPSMTDESFAPFSKPALGDDFFTNQIMLAVSTSIGSGAMIVEIRDESGNTIIDATSGIISDPNYFVARFKTPVALTRGKKYRIYVTRAAMSPVGTTVRWLGANATDGVDRYVPGISSAGGDFTFETNQWWYGEYRDQFCTGKGQGVQLQEGKYHWQEFVVMDPRLVLTTVTLPLRHTLESPEEVFVDIRDENGNVIKTSSPVSTTTFGGSLREITFSFPSPVIVLRTATYQIYPRRSWFSVFPFYGVYWGIEYENAMYRYGRAREHEFADYGFTTDANGRYDQAHGYYSSRYPSPLSANQETSPWQTFRPGVAWWEY
jgi:hypothetical protein